MKVTATAIPDVMVIEPKVHGDPWYLEHSDWVENVQSGAYRQ